VLINEDSPCTVCEKKGFICTKEDKIRGPKTEQRNRSNGNPSTSEVPGQFVFSVNLPPSMRPAEPIRTPNGFREGEGSPMDQPSETFLNTNVLQAPDKIVDGGYTIMRDSGQFYRDMYNDAKLKAEPANIPWDDWLVFDSCMAPRIGREATQSAYMPVRTCLLYYLLKFPGAYGGNLFLFSLVVNVALFAIFLTCLFFWRRRICNK